MMRQSKINTLLIKTPEGIVFSLLLAGPVTRFLAWAVDLACIGALSSAVGTLLGLTGAWLGSAISAVVAPRASVDGTAR